MNYKKTNSVIRHNKLRFRIGIILILSALLITNYPLLSFYPVVATDEVKMGQAKRGENGIKNNEPGEQNGKEVFVTDWSYSIFPRASEHWAYVLRAKDPNVGRRMAENMKKACANKHIGYDQNYPDRGTLYTEAAKVGWDLSKVKTDCETTCTCIISVCLNAEGIKVPKLWMSGDVKDDLEATGLFYIFDSKEYTTKSKNLAVGDILVSPGMHSAMIVESPHAFTYPVKYKNAKGKKETAQIDENSRIVLNLNNGEDAEILRADKELDLADNEPAKQGFSFEGWEKTGKNTFSAQYSGKMSGIGLNSNAKDIP